MGLISSLAGLMSLCGISSMRMFAPTFLFGAICRFLPEYSWCPEGIARIAENCPPFLMSDFGLCVFGALGVLEVIANWDDTVRELISESNVDTYVKPVFATLMTYSILTPEQAQVVAEVVGETANEAACPDSGSSFSTIGASLLCCGGTFGLCKVRAGIVTAVRELDPDNALQLNTLLTLFEEGSWLVILPILLVFPLLALLLLTVFAGFGWLLSRPLKEIAEKRRAYWDALGKARMLRAVRVRAVVIFGLGVLLSVVPVFGYLTTVIALNLFVFSVIALYESRSRRIVFRFVVRFIKLTIFLVAILFSSIPFMGIILLLPHVISFLIRTKKIG